MEGGDKSYEVLPYPNLFFKHSHPDQLATIASLYGMQPADVSRCRVLELGCAAGANVIPMAEQLPSAQFVGVDASSAQIAQGLRRIEQLELSNIKLLELNLMSITPQLGEFDYIIAHGVYSWVPPAVRDKVLDICARNLAPQGVAYVSYNTNPGWRTRGIVRDMMLYHTRGIAGPIERVAAVRKFLAAILKSLANRKEPYAAPLRAEIERVLQRDSGIVFHDYMEEFNEPVYVHEFAAHAAAHGLQILAEADPATMVASDLDAEGRQALMGMGGTLEREQYLDFVRNQSFRKTLLCHAPVALNRAFSLEPFDRLFAASMLAPQAPRDDSPESTDRFASPAGLAMSTSDPTLRQALHALAEVAPRRIALKGLLHGDAKLAQMVLECYAFGGFDLATRPTDFATAVTNQPIARRLARLQAGEGEVVTNMRHELVRLDPARRKLLQLLDGTRDRARIAQEMGMQLSEADTALRRVMGEALLVE